MAEQPPSEEEGGVRLVREITDLRIKKVLSPHLFRFVGLALGLVVAFISLYIIQSIFADAFLGFIEFMTNLFSPPYNIIGFFLGIFLIVLILWVAQAVITWAVVRFLLKQQRVQITRTRIQHLVARIMKWFGIGLFLAIFLALVGAGILVFPPGDPVQGSFISGAIFLGLIYAGSSIGQMLTDMLFYHYYRKEQEKKGR